jgi:hypothetical protein
LPPARNFSLISSMPFLAYSRMCWVTPMEKNFGPHIEQKCAAEVEAHLGECIVAQPCRRMYLAGSAARAAIL